ncbi:hypothetical protein D3C77_54590 [compost metagenome]
MPKGRSWRWRFQADCHGSKTHIVQGRGGTGLGYAPRPIRAYRLNRLLTAFRFLDESFQGHQFVA